REKVFDGGVPDLGRERPRMPMPSASDPSQTVRRFETVVGMNGRALAGAGLALDQLLAQVGGGGLQHPEVLQRVIVERAGDLQRADGAAVIALERHGQPAI